MNHTRSRHVTILTVFFLLTLFSAQCLAASYVRIKKDGVNIRSGAGTDHEILWEVFKDFPLKVLKRKGEWIQVQDFEGDKGWVFKNLVTKDKRVIVKVNTANMRVGPGKDYELVATVKYGVVFTPIDKDGDWIKVKHADGTTGWIFKKLLWPSNPL